MASVNEIKNAIKEIKKYHKKIIIMHCISSYPTYLKDTNLKKIKKLKLLYKDCLVGISDHTNDIISSVASVPIGVVAIEKHLKINNKIKTADSLFSIVPKQLKNLKENTVDLHKSLRSSLFNVEKISKKLRRSIYAKETIKKNCKISSDNIDTLRPFIGMCSSNYFKIIGKKAKRDINLGEPIFKKMIT